MSDPLDLDVQVAGPGEIDAFVALLEEAGGWLWRRGIRQWEPGSHRAQFPRFEKRVLAKSRALESRGDRA